MNKPIKQQVVQPMLNYFDVIKHIEEKYKIKTRDYHKTYPKDKTDWREYMDFWHWLVDKIEIHNDSSAYFSIEEYLSGEDIPEWIKEILNLIKTEFKDEFDQDGGLEVWISW